MGKIAPLLVAACSAAVPQFAAAVDLQHNCIWSNSLRLLEIKTSTVLALNTITGRSISAVARPAVCTNPLCLSEERPLLLHGVLNLIQAVFDPATQSGFYLGQVIYGGRIATVEMPTTFATVKFVFSDGSQEMFTQFSGCAIPLRID